MYHIGLQAVDGSGIWITAPGQATGRLNSHVQGISKSLSCHPADRCFNSHHLVSYPSSSPWHICICRTMTEIKPITQSIQALFPEQAAFDTGLQGMRDPPPTCASPGACVPSTER